MVPYPPCHVPMYSEPLHPSSSSYVILSQPPSASIHFHHEIAPVIFRPLPLSVRLVFPSQPLRPPHAFPFHIAPPRSLLSWPREKVAREG